MAEDGNKLLDWTEISREFPNIVLFIFATYFNILNEFLREIQVSIGF